MQVGAEEVGVPEQLVQVGGIQVFPWSTGLSGGRFLLLLIYSV
jgi:hypothetical protein